MSRVGGGLYVKHNTACIVLAEKSPFQIYSSATCIKKRQSILPAPLAYPSRCPYRLSIWPAVSPALWSARLSSSLACPSHPPISHAALACPSRLALSPAPDPASHHQQLNTYLPVVLILQNLISYLLLSLSIVSTHLIVSPLTLVPCLSPADSTPPPPTPYPSSPSCAGKEEKVFLTLKIKEVKVILEEQATCHLCRKYYLKVLSNEN